MNEYSKTLYTALKEDLELIAELGTLPIRRYTAALTAIKEALFKLFNYTDTHPFKSLEEEIDFFKHEKPLYVSEQLYAQEIFNFETNRPIGDSQALKNYYELELQFIKRFFNQYQFLYQYYLFELKELDELLFVRGIKPSDIILPENAGSDVNFSTACDGLFARFIANERLQAYVLAELKSLNSPIVQVAVESDSVELKWTGESINLVELAYGIWLTGQINHGNATITDIIKWMELHFQISIGRAYKRWTSISKRKRVTPTKFIDQLKAALMKRLDDENDIR